MRRSVADYTRFAQRSSDPIPAQLLTELAIASIPIPFGIICTSAAVKIFPAQTTLLWAPYDLLVAFQQQSGGTGARVGSLFAGSALVFCQLGTNIMV